ncbi:MAG: hypothetical protein JXO51_07060 [Candidatus Aminicenantes bacterium]|nr:hypothetical protein [Candidatus Aminicenantes bacterium]
MFRDDVYLRRENDLFVFDRRENRLFRIVGGERREVTDRDVVAMIVTGPAKVLAGEHVGFGDRQASDLVGA